MKSTAFPKMFSGNSTYMYDDDVDSLDINDRKKKKNMATLTSMHLLLSTEVGELLGDPEFGIKLKTYTFDQNSYVLKDILIDEIYTKITTFVPQVYLERKNIKIKQEGSKLYARIVCKNKDNFQTNMFDLVLFNGEEES